MPYITDYNGAAVMTIRDPDSTRFISRLTDTSGSTRLFPSQAIHVTQNTDIPVRAGIPSASLSEFSLVWNSVPNSETIGRNIFLWQPYNYVLWTVLVPTTPTPPVVCHYSIAFENTPADLDISGGGNGTVNMRVVRYSNDMTAITGLSPNMTFYYGGVQSNSFTVQAGEYLSLGMLAGTGDGRTLRTNGQMIAHFMFRSGGTWLNISQ